MAKTKSQQPFEAGLASKVKSFPRSAPPAASEPADVVPLNTAPAEAAVNQETTSLPEPEPAATPSPKRRMSSATRKNKSRFRKEEAGVRVALHFAPELEERLRMHCAKTRQSLSNATSEALSMWLSKQGG